MSSGDPRERLLRAVAAELNVGPMARRRILTELTHHIDDAVDDLRGSGAPREEAIEEAVKRLGDAQTIASAFGILDTRRAGWSRLRTRHSLAWVAVAAMSGVTACAAELPSASGAKSPPKVLVPASHRPSPYDPPTTRRSARRGRLGERG